MDEPTTSPEPGTRAPRWVKAFGTVVLLVVVVLVVMLLLGGDGHGPGRHTGGLGDRRPPASMEPGSQAP